MQVHTILFAIVLNFVIAMPLPVRSVQFLFVFVFYV